MVLYLSLIHSSIAQVKSILKEETYIGHSVHNKQSNISFKNKKKVRKPQEEWYRCLLYTSFRHLSLHNSYRWLFARKYFPQTLHRRKQSPQSFSLYFKGAPSEDTRLDLWFPDNRRTGLSLIHI